MSIGTCGVQKTELPQGFVHLFGQSTTECMWFQISTSYCTPKYVMLVAVMQSICFVASIAACLI